MDESSSSIYSDLPRLNNDEGSEELRPASATSEVDAALEPFELAAATNFHIVSTLGIGNFGKTMLAFHTSCPAHRVVLKTPRGPGQGTGMLRREAAVLRALSHPHIIPFRDFIDVPGQPLLLVMDFAAGGSLADRLCRGPPLTACDVSRLIYQVLQALDYVHSKGIVHLDVK